MGHMLVQLDTHLKECVRRLYLDQRHDASIIRASQLDFKIFGFKAIPFDL